jgi:hypothetical protein
LSEHTDEDHDRSERSVFHGQLFVALKSRREPTENYILRPLVQQGFGQSRLFT